MSRGGLQLPYREGATFLESCTQGARVPAVGKVGRLLQLLFNSHPLLAVLSTRPPNRNRNARKDSIWRSPIPCQFGGVLGWALLNDIS